MRSCNVDSVLISAALSRQSWGFGRWISRLYHTIHIRRTASGSVAGQTTNPQAAKLLLEGLPVWTDPAYVVLRRSPGTVARFDEGGGQRRYLWFDQWKLVAENTLELIR